MHGVSFPKETEFRSLGAGVRTTDSVASGPLILKRIGKASALLDRIHGVQGDFDDRCKVVATMVNATGLHASKIVGIGQKDIRPFETRILKAIWGALCSVGGVESKKQTGRQRPHLAAIKRQFSCNVDPLYIRFWSLSP